MGTICEFLLFDHKRCDTLFMRLGESINQQDWNEACARFQLFNGSLKRHLRMEEQVLFPAFEQAIRNSEQPIAMLRIEHRQIRCLIKRMSDAVARMDSADFQLHAESFTLLSEQHSLKEEEMLYPLLDKVLFLSDKRDQVIQAMSEFRDADANATPSLADMADCPHINGISGSSVQ